MKKLALFAAILIAGCKGNCLWGIGANCLDDGGGITGPPPPACVVPVPSCFPDGQFLPSGYRCQGSPFGVYTWGLNGTAIGDPQGFLKAHSGDIVQVCAPCGCSQGVPLP